MALSKQDPRLAFHCEQHDSFSNITRQYVLFFFYEDASVEITEVKRNTLFLKRTRVPCLKKEDFHLGATLTIMGRLVRLTNYADEVTRQLCEEKSEMTVFLLGEAALPAVGRYLAILTEECGFRVAAMQMAWVESEAAATFGIPDVFVGGRAVVVEAVRANAMAKGLEYVQRVHNVTAAGEVEEVRRWSQFLQRASENPVAVFGDFNSSVVIVKPHVLKENAGGAVVQQLIDTGLEPTGLMLVNLTSRVVDNFFEAYKGVLPDFEEAAQALLGPVWIMQFVSLGDGVDVVSAVREICGPFDPTIAKIIRPKSLRARFGVDRARNAVHCCDLPEEGPFYTDFFFKNVRLY